MKKHLLYFFCFAILFTLIFKDLIVNVSTNLIDWRDYSYLTWVVNQNLTHLKTLDFQNLFNQNAFYPYKNTLFLSDTLLTQAVLGVPVSFFTNNPILIFNTIFVTTIFLNYISSYLLFYKLFNKKLVAFVGGLSMVFSPFFFTQIGHFQMQSYWPFIFALYFVLKGKNVLAGFFLVIQFLASVYVAFFGLVAISIFFAVKTVKEKKLKNSLIKLVMILITFLLLGGVFINGYLSSKRSFEIQRNVGEYLSYSAKLSDYLFPKQNGIFYQNRVVKKILTYNSHHLGETASFPGFFLGLFFILGLIKFRNSKSEFSLLFSSNLLDLFFLAIMIVGFIFSLGYPYIPFVKFLPFFDTIRGVSRWSFLFYFGVVYFSMKFISKIDRAWVLSIAAIFLILDVLPTPITTIQDRYLNKNDEALKGLCSKEKAIILEIPVTHFDSGENIAEGLTYITKRLLATSYNNCTLVNGYSGYDLPSIQNLMNDLQQAKTPNDFYVVVKASGANYISVNKSVLPQNLYTNIETQLSSLERNKKLIPVGDGVYKIN